jgi:hypothetical protein
VTTAVDGCTHLAERDAPLTDGRGRRNGRDVGTALGERQLGERLRTVARAVFTFCTDVSAPCGPDRRP